MLLCVMLQPDLGRDEFTFRPMGHRLSFVSSPESDYDIAAGDDTNNGEAPSRRPTRASSDPSIAVADNILPRPVEPPPAPPRPDVQSHLAYDPRYVCITCTLLKVPFFLFLSVISRGVIKFVKVHSCADVVTEQHINAVFVLFILVF